MKATFIFLFLLLCVAVLGVLAVVSFGLLKMLDKADELLEMKRRDEAKRAMRHLRKVTRKNNS
ncbi:MAG: hypothetical protein WA004_05045 [Saprospiraceae bacterium]